jgi:L-histidine N-alpha-methyltransferase
MTDLTVYLTQDDIVRGLRSDVLTGLTATPKTLPPKWFYDARGSDLFERITTVPEYYPTRAEREVLADRADEIATLTGAHTLVELGSGSSEKTRLLLDALHRTGTLDEIVALDVSGAALESSVALLRDAYGPATVHGIVGDFTQHLALLPGAVPRLVVFLGGTIGNLVPAERAKFLTALRDNLQAGEWLLMGTDLVKDEATLVQAYDDAAGVTAEFNRNVLHVLNRELAADFDVDAFAHVARWDPREEWIEMRLRATRAMEVRVRGVDLTVSFAEGEELRTEVSAKFTPTRVANELSEAGFALTRWWTDRAGRFGVSLSQVTA